ncbi:MAG: hypothetical protein ACOYXU_04240 [Nitrospirota bacterium]
MTGSGISNDSAFGLTRRRRLVRRITTSTSVFLALSAGMFGAASWAQEPAAPSPPVQEAPVKPPPNQPLAAPPAASSIKPAETTEPPAPKIPALADRLYLLNASIIYRGDDTSRIGIGLAAEMRSPLPYELLGGPGIEIDLFQSQANSKTLSFIPVYWAVEYRPMRKYPDAYMAGRLGFDTLGQAGDDTLASRNYYAVSVGMLTRVDRPKALQWELTYSRMRGAYPGIAISVGLRY